MVAMQPMCRRDAVCFYRTRAEVFARLVNLISDSSMNRAKADSETTCDDTLRLHSWLDEMSERVTGIA